MTSTQPTKSKDITISKDKTISFILTINQSTSKVEYQKIVKDAAKHVEIKGFRKGKAPLDLAEKELSPNKIYDQVIQNVLPKKYEQIIKENKLNPVIRPQIILKNPPLSLDKDWQFEITICQKPELKLSAFETELKALNKQDYTDTQDQNRKILDLIIKKAKVTIPKVLLDTQIRDRITQLIDSASQVGMTLKQFLDSKDTTIEKYQQSLSENFTREWIISLSLDKIAEDKKIIIDPKEIQKNVDPNNQTEYQYNLSHYILKQQKTLDYLRQIK